jgi:lipid-A-disaccharide synthase
MKKVYVIAGEASGDMHGKNLLREMKALRPDLELRGVGGDGLESVGMTLVRHIRDTNFMGFVQVIQNIWTIRNLFKQIQRDIQEWKPDVVLLIDYPGFNLRMAKFAHKLGIRVFYFISPQIWAWKKSRIKQIRAYVDHMFPILPFEKEFYANEGMEVDYCGHPLLDEMKSRTYQTEDIRQGIQRQEGPTVALLPGSRQQEVSRMLPLMLKMVDHFPDCNFVVAGSPTLEESLYQEYMAESPVPLVMGRTYDVLSLADYALVTSGTATLETALMQVPEVVCYHANGLSVWIARKLVKVKFISLVNLIMDREVVRELIQQDFTENNLVAELQKLMDPAHKRQLMADYETLRAKLGNEGASGRLAQKMVDYLHQPRSKG